MPEKRNEWCPRKACTPYNAPEQLCSVCLCVYHEVVRQVESAVKAEKERILRELPGVFGQTRT